MFEQSPAASTFNYRRGNVPSSFGIRFDRPKAQLDYILDITLKTLTRVPTAHTLRNLVSKSTPSLMYSHT